MAGGTDNNVINTSRLNTQLTHMFGKSMDSSRHNFLVLFTRGVVMVSAKHIVYTNMNK